MSSNPKPIVTSSKGIPGIWYIPLLALLVGLWMTYQHYSSLGPKVYIEFQNAEGLEPGKTKIKSLSVDIGVVESIDINENFNGVLVVAQLRKEADPLIRQDSQFWIVRPRITSAGISGLGTLLSGAYIELTPGTQEVDKRRKKEFVGLDEVPKTPADAPGLHLKLTSTESVSVSSGDPITFRGYMVGSIESVELDTQTEKMIISCFVRPPFDSLVTTNSKFWNASGISFKASAEGFKVSTESFTSMIRGGIAFDLPRDSTRGDPVENHATFKLYRDQDSINERAYEYYVDYLLYFNSSVSGLDVGAPVTFRGIRIGTVKQISFSSYAQVDQSRRDGKTASIPVIIRIEPGRFSGEDSERGLVQSKQVIEERIKDGMRATIKLANLLTGSKLIAINYEPNAEPAKIEIVNGMTVLPTAPGEIDQIGHEISELVGKLNKIQYEKISSDADVMLQKFSITADSASKSLDELNKILSNSHTHNLSKSLDETLLELKEVLKGFSPDADIYHDLTNSVEQLNETLRNLESITHTMDSQPNSLIFSKPKPADIQPEVSK